MDFSDSGFWQHVLIAVLIIPYFVGICLSAIYTHTLGKRRPARNKDQSHRSSPSEVVRESQTGRIMATCGATLLALLFSGASVAAVIWVIVWALGLPGIIFQGLLVLGSVPVAWATLWTAGRAWHVESLIGAGKDVDQPVFRIGEYLPLAFLRRSVPKS
jgi:hypothetical protein